MQYQIVIILGNKKPAHGGFVVNIDYLIMTITRYDIYGV